MESFMTTFDVNASRHLAKQARIDVLNMIHESHASHIASAFSCIDILAVLYSGIDDVNVENIKMQKHDRIILSKGHAGSALYAVLAEKNFISRNLLKTYYANGSFLSGHVSHKNINGVEFSTGSLGQGVCVACGMALANKIHKNPAKVFAVVGDGEIEEGSVWEMAQFAALQKLSNFIVVVDANKMQAMGNTNEIVVQNISSKWKAFGWNVIEVDDGNDHIQLVDAFSHLDPILPTAVVANTIKGKGVSFMENCLLWHYRDPQGDFYEKALKELENM